MKIRRRINVVNITMTREEYFCFSWLMAKVKIEDLQVESLEGYFKVIVDTICRKELKVIKDELNEFNDVT